MAKLLVLYNQPSNEAAFDAHYHGLHVPLAKKVPGVRKIEVSTGKVMTEGEASPYHLVALLTFNSMADLKAGLASPEGQEAIADVPNFATGGATLVAFQEREL